MSYHPRVLPNLRESYTLSEKSSILTSLPDPPVIKYSSHKYVSDLWVMTCLLLQAAVVLDPDARKYCYRGEIQWNKGTGRGEKDETDRDLSVEYEAPPLKVEST